MSYLVDGYYGESVASAPPSERVRFIRRTYAHLAAAVLAWVGASAALIATGTAEQIIRNVFLANRMAWLLLMVVFMVGTVAAQYMARSRSSVGMQYAGLALYVSLYTLLFLPILTIASDPKFGIGNPKLPLQAGLVTLAAFGALTVAVFVSGKDFSFMGPMLAVASLVLTVVIVCAGVFGFSLGLGFCGLMVALFAGIIIYNTSNVMHQYGTSEHVAASMALFGSFAMLFYYILQIFMLSGRDD